MANAGFPSIVYLIKNCLWNESGKHQLTPDHLLINYFKNIIKTGRCTDAKKLVVGHDQKGGLTIDDTNSEGSAQLRYAIHFSPLAIEINDYFKEALITGQLLSHMDGKVVVEVYQTFKVCFDFADDKNLFIKSFELIKTYHPSESFLTVIPPHNTVAAAAA